MLKKISALLLITVFSYSLSAQNYERYKVLQDTVIASKNLGFTKGITVTVPVEWQKGTKNKFPLIIVFDRQNKRSHSYILQTIDYLTSTEQMPSAVIISVASEQRFRYIETQYKEADVNGVASENEKFIFEELIPFANKQYNTSDFRVLIGHSRYGYFTTSLFSTRTKDLNGVISMSPFFTQKNVDLTDSIRKMNETLYTSKKYYRYGIGNDFPEDFSKMDSTLQQLKLNESLDIKGYRFKQASHDTTPGLIISAALYELFEQWSAIQGKYISNNQKELDIKTALDNEIVSHYGAPLNFSIGILNGKGWYFYNEKDYAKAIKAWEILVNSYPNFSQGYLAMIKAQIKLKQNYDATLVKFKKSLNNSELYKENEKEGLMKELKEIIE